MGKIGRNIVWMAGFVVACILGVQTVYAGEINSNEQQLVRMASGVYLYNGALYKVNDAYIGKVSEYLSRDDVDLNASQVSAYRDLFYANLANGIEGGYLVKIKDFEEEPKKPSSGTGSQKPSSGENSSAGDSTSGEDMSGRTESEKTEASENRPEQENVGNSETVIPTEMVEGSEIATEIEAGTETETVTEAIAGTEKTESTEHKNKEYATEQEEETEYIDVAELDIDSRLVGNEKDLELIFGPIQNTSETTEVSETTEQETQEQDTEEQKQKNYSNANPLAHNVNLTMLAACVAIITVIVAGGILIRHKLYLNGHRKNSHRKRRK